MKWLNNRPKKPEIPCEFYNCKRMAYGTSVISGRKLCSPHLVYEQERAERNKRKNG